MKKDFVSVFNKDISIDEYRLDSMLGKNIKVKENEFPTILIDKEDDTNKYININNNSNLDLNENSITKDNIAKSAEIDANGTDISASFATGTCTVTATGKNNFDGRTATITCDSTGCKHNK